MIKKTFAALAVVMTLGAAAPASAFYDPTPGNIVIIDNQHAVQELVYLLGDVTGADDVRRQSIVRYTMQVLNISETELFNTFGQINDVSKESTRTLYNIIFAVEQVQDAFIDAEVAAAEAARVAEAAAVIAAEEAAQAAEVEAARVAAAEAAQIEADKAAVLAAEAEAQAAVEAAEARQAELTAEIAAQTAAMIQAETDARIAIQTAIEDAQTSIVERVAFLTGEHTRFEDIGTPLASLLNESDAYALTVEVYQGPDGIADVMSRLDYNVIVTDLGDGTSIVAQRHLQGVGAYIVTN